MSDSPIFVTVVGRQILQEQLNEKRRRYKEICDERTVAHELSGDGWHDNPHFNYLQQMEATATREIAALNGLLARARMFRVANGCRPLDRVALGSVVTVLICDLPTGDETLRTFEIVGFQETQADAGRLAYNVPLVAGVMGLEVGDSVEVRLPTGTVEVEVAALHEDTSMLLARETIPA